MKKLKNILLLACTYTVILITVFFLFIAVDSGIKSAITFGSFLAIFLIGCLISLSNLILGINGLSYPIKIILHFSSLLASLFTLLFTTGFLTGKTPSSYIVLIFAYALIYAVVWIICYFIRKGKTSFSKRTKKVDAKSKEKKAEKSEYKPLYK